MNSAVRSHQGNALWMLGILLLFLLIRFGLFVGIVGSDDVSIASESLKVLSDGFYVPFNHYSARIGLIYPQALVFALFGVGEWQMALLPLLSSLGGVLLAYAIARHYAGERAGLVAALILAVFPLDAYFSSQLMPDLPLGVMIGLSFYLLIRAEQRQQAALAVIAGIAWGWAYLIKVEAFFFLFVVLTLWLVRQLSWRTVFVCGLAVGMVVLAEHVIYFLASGDPLLRLHLATVQGGGKVFEEYSAAQLWVFPKAWFLTPYYFGLHYYLLFFSVLWLLIRRTKSMLPIVVWVAIYLFWLQFGGNPFSEHYSVKTHLDRYCNMLNIPMAVAIAVTLRDLAEKWGARYQQLALAGVVMVSFLFIPFNQLSAERELATKQLLDVVKSEGLYPLYLDRTSLTLATMYLYEEGLQGKLHTLQKHDFIDTQTELTPAAEVQGYVLINKGFVEYGWNRYRVSRVTPEMYASRLSTYRVADNPMSGMSYASARLLRWFAGFIPLERFRAKIRHTADELLAGNDAVLMGPK